MELEKVACLCKRRVIFNAPHVQSMSHHSSERAIRIIRRHTTRQLRHRVADQLRTTDGTLHKHRSADGRIDVSATDATDEQDDDGERRADDERVACRKNGQEQEERSEKFSNEGESVHLIRILLSRDSFSLKSLSHCSLRKDSTRNVHGLQLLHE